MKTKHFFLVAGIAFFSLTACEGQKNKTTKSSITTKVDSVSYGIGLSLGQNFKKDNWNEIDADLISKGIKDVFKNDSSVMKMKDVQTVIQSFAQEKAKKKAEANLEKGKKFLEENAKKEGVKTLPSGLQYQVMKDGSGPKPALTDKVSVHYHGTLMDGSVFDSSVFRGQPAEFGVNQVIPGWTEALQLMPVGSKWKLWIPSSLAYGETSPGGTIGPNETLIFEVELLAIVKPDAQTPKESK
jgi:FKBP-type peptidyl-prolyl cis-trans isomerase FklB